MIEQKNEIEQLKLRIAELEQTVAGYEKIQSASRQSEANFKKASAIMETLFDAIPDVLGVQDTEHKILQYNKAGYDFIKSTPDKVKGLKCYEILGRKEPCSICATSEVYKTLKPAWREKFVKEMGLWLDVRSYPVFDDQGRLSMVIEHLRDITELKNIEITLKENEKKYRQIFNATNDGIVIHNAKSGLIQDANDKMLSMFGYKKEEIIGMSLDQIGSGIAPYHHKSAKKNIENAVRKGNVIFEWHSKKKQGDLFWAEVNFRCSKIDEGNKIIGVFRDITERKKTQAVMIQTEKMMSIGGLAAGMAHEINNPLAGMIQNSDVMQRRLMDSGLKENIKTAHALGLDFESIKQYMIKRKIPDMTKAIKQSGVRLSNIVENMLSFARNSDANVSSHSIGDLLDKTLELVRTDYNLKKHQDFRKIKIIKEYSTVPMVLCESSKIQQVFFNILKNGSEAMQDAGTKNPRFILRLRFDETNQFVVVEIEDNGPGMNEDIRARVFEPFFTTKPVGIGTGLGLSVSYFIVTEAHKGAMSILSKPGKGANFIIHLPVDPSSRK
jgi:PAS domain S-box-containing protein